MIQTARMPLIGLLAVLLPLAGCDRSGTPDAKSVTKPQTVEQRAQAKWDAIVARDWKKVYDFLTPAKKKVIRQDAFIARRAAGALAYDSARVEKADCQGDSCQVAIQVTYTYQGKVAAMRGMKSTSRVLERWVRLNGRWWFLPE